MEILLTSKLARLVNAHGALYKDRVEWVKAEGVEGSNIGIACMYAPNILIEPHDKFLTQKLCMDFWGHSNMTERLNNKFNDCGRAISD